jgi:hypothetical protein
MDSHIRCTQAARSDIEWWYLFSEDWNGVAMLSLLRKDNPDSLLTSDASGNWGCGAFSDNRWFQLQWAGKTVSLHITVKELIPIVIATAVWGGEWQGKTVRVLCDNEAVVNIINSGSSSALRLCT